MLKSTKYCTFLCVLFGTFIYYAYLCNVKQEVKHFRPPAATGNSGTKIMTTNTICKGYTRDGRRVKVEERYDSIAVCLGIFVIIEDGYKIDEIEKPGRDSAISLFKWFVTK